MKKSAPYYKHLKTRIPLADEQIRALREKINDPVYLEQTAEWIAEHLSGAQNKAHIRDYLLYFNAYG